MDSIKREAEQWNDFAAKSRVIASKVEDRFSQSLFKIADLSEHISAAMERIANIMESTQGCCECGKCPPPKSSHLQ